MYNSDLALNRRSPCSTFKIISSLIALENDIIIPEDSTRIPEQESTDIAIYGKTGMGKAEGVVVDAWFTGFAESAEGNLYFCVHLGRTDDMDVSSFRAREIAIQIFKSYRSCGIITLKDPPK